MPEQAVLRDELANLQKAASRLADEIKTLQNFIAADERNLQHALEAVRVNARQSLANYRTNLAQKQTELQDVQQEQHAKQQIVGKLDAIGKKEVEVQALEREKDRIIERHERARMDLEQLRNELAALEQPAAVPACELIMANGQHIPLPTHDTELLLGCTDAADGIFPDIDLTPFGGTGSGVSRRHATLSFRNRQWTIRDENSTNGTFVGDTRIAPHVPHPVTHHTVLRFGGVPATFAFQVAPAGKTRRLSGPAAPGS